MKLVKSIRMFWDKQKKYEKLTIITILIAVILQIIFELIIPIFIKDLPYNKDYLAAIVVIIFFSSAFIYIVSLIFYYFLIKHLNNKKEKIVIISIMLIVTLVIGSIFTLKEIEHLYSVTIQDYEELLEVAEMVDSKEKLYELSNSFSWNASTNNHSANFVIEKGSIKVLYSDNFDILNVEWTDNIVPVYFLICILFCVDMIATIIVSSIVLFILKHKNKNEF